MATQAATKFNGKVKVSIDSEGKVICTPTATEGIFGQMLEGTTSLLSTQDVVVGNGAIFQRFLVGGLGNGLAHFAHTGKLGVAVTNKFQFSLGG